MSDLHEAAQHVRPPSATGYATMTVNGIRIAAAVAGGRVYWEARDSGPVHLHVDPDPHLLTLIKELRQRWPAENLAEFDAACRGRGLEPAKW